MDFDNNGNIECSHCCGRKIVPVSNVTLYRICPQCNGKGGTDWVSHIMGRSDINIENVSLRLMQENIFKLVQAIKNEAQRAGHVVDVSILHRNSLTDYLKNEPMTETEINILKLKERELDNYFRQL